MAVRHIALLTLDDACGVDDEAAFAAYRDHPAHQAVLDQRI